MQRVRRRSLSARPRARLAQLTIGFAVMFLPVASAVAGDSLVADGSSQRPTSPAQQEGSPAGATVEVRLEDESVLKVVVRDEKLEMVTRFGKLAVPVSEIEKIEFGRRLSPEVATNIAGHVAALGAKDFPSREAATQALLKLREKGYGELLKAAKSKDAEVARRAEQMLQKIRETVPDDKLHPPEFDVIQTSDGSRFVGRIEMHVFKVRTVAFGEQQLKLADVRSLRSLSYEEPEEVVADALPDPGNMTAFQGQTGKTVTLKVTGRAGGAAPQQIAGGAVVVVGGGTVWGTDLYTLDSTIALAAVHAGALKAGQTGVVRIRVLGPQPTFQGSERNGVQSMAYGFYNGAYQFDKGRRGSRSHGESGR